MLAPSHVFIQVVTFHMDTAHPPIPAIAVASAAHIYIYKVRSILSYQNLLTNLHYCQNLRPYFKFTLPTLDILPAEKDIWSQAAGESIEHGQVSRREMMDDGG